MKVSKEEILHIAKLADLEIKDEEIEKYEKRNIEKFSIIIMMVIIFFFIKLIIGPYL